MIDWDATKRYFNRDNLDGRRPKVIMCCDTCGKHRVFTVRVKSKVINNQLEWYCPKCVTNRSDVKESLSAATKKSWEDQSYREKITESSKSVDEKTRQRISQSTKIGWENGRYDGVIQKRWEDESYRQKIVEHSKKLWDDESFRSQMARASALRPKVSSIQHILYSILDDLGIKYFREYNNQDDDPQVIIGPYNFDCLVPREGLPDLLIECQGDYWHSIDENRIRDKQKASYIENHFSTQYELKYLWEHEFYCKDRIAELLLYWTGATKQYVCDFSFKNVDIRIALAKDYKLLLSKYHYLPNAGRGGIAYGAYLNNEIIAVCVFSPLVRQNLPWDPQSSRELSRLCIHPRYQKKNFASWFVSRCIRYLNKKYKYIISYCDTTFNHNGAIYKACNFRFDGDVKPDYWYADEHGWVMHKKTLYNHARSLGVTESEFAKEHQYKKIYGKKKLRFIYERLQ